MSRLAAHDFTITNVLMDTDICPLKDSIKTYNYMCRILLERVSWFLSQNNATANIVLSSRGTKRDGELIDYIRYKLLDYDFNSINNVFTKIESKPASCWDMLQLADVCATSMFRSHETNSLGFVTPCHMSNLKDKVYKHNNKMINYGLKYYAKEMIPSKDYWNAHKLCNK